MNNFWTFPDITNIHIELTNGCNAACPNCVRFYKKSPLIRPDLEIRQIYLEQFKRYFPPEILQKCKRILFCGVSGDAGTARDTLEILQYIDENTKNTDVCLITNGGMRDPQWWSEVGKIFSKKYSWSVTFSIDGLEDTNHVYRRKVKWDKLMANVKAYIDAGGYAIWDYLVFKHNEHQIAEAESFSKSLGFSQFRLKKALGLHDGNNVSIMNAMDKNGKLQHKIEPPENLHNRNNMNTLNKLKDHVPEFDPDQYWKIKKSPNDESFKNLVKNVYEKIEITTNQYDKVDICCKSDLGPNQKEIFVDQRGIVMPCCYIGTQLNGVYEDDMSLQLHNAMETYGWDNFDLNKKTLQSILEEGHLNKLWAESWGKQSIKDGKMAFCAFTCPKSKNSIIDKIW